MSPSCLSRASSQFVRTPHSFVPRPIQATPAHSSRPFLRVSPLRAFSKKTESTVEVEATSSTDTEDDCLTPEQVAMFTELRKAQQQ
eukprot:gene18777-25317_t